MLKDSIPPKGLLSVMQKEANTSLEQTVSYFFVSSIFFKINEAIILSKNGQGHTMLLLTHSEYFANLHPRSAGRMFFNLSF